MTDLCMSNTKSILRGGAAGSRLADAGAAGEEGWIFAEEEEGPQQPLRDLLVVRHRFSVPFFRLAVSKNW